MCFKSVIHAWEDLTHIGYIALYITWQRKRAVVHRSSKHIFVTDQMHYSHSPEA